MCEQRHVNGVISLGDEVNISWWNALFSSLRKKLKFFIPPKHTNPWEYS